VATDAVDGRLVGLQDVMPTLLDLSGLPIPDAVKGLSMVGELRREVLFGECREGRNATRMVHDGRHKLIWYPAGNVVQLFDLQLDPDERTDCAADRAYAEVRDRLSRLIAEAAWGADAQWIVDGRLAGVEPVVSA